MCKNPAFGIFTKETNFAKTAIQKEVVRTPQEEQAFISEMKEKDNMYTVIQVENRVVGISRLIRGELEMKQHVALFRTWLASEAQGKGIGSKIMEYTLSWAEIHKLHKVVLTVFSGNMVATKLYQKYGFTIEGIQKEQVMLNGEYQDEIYMGYFVNEKIPQPF
ncbi:GNAT family N-acetyltransferase [Anaerobacillus alkaliphilus]|uniref:GNAT family N-acetyltransferase n=1 Tax=Anaerobacillus alkaliphilus TaxID=1548597 RepID=UPI001F4F436E|nr:GNAT family protein [Anaerobacillus alkaliphilus]